MKFKKRKAWRSVDFIPVYRVGGDEESEVRCAQGQRRPVLDEMLGGLMVPMHIVSPDYLKGMPAEQAEELITATSGQLTGVTVEQLRGMTAEPDTSWRGKGNRYTPAIKAAAHRPKSPEFYKAAELLQAGYKVAAVATVTGMTRQGVYKVQKQIAAGEPVTPAVVSAASVPDSWMLKTKKALYAAGKCLVRLRSLNSTWTTPEREMEDLRAAVAASAGRDAGKILAVLVCEDLMAEAKDMRDTLQLMGAQWPKGEQAEQVGPSPAQLQYTALYARLWPDADALRAKADRMPCEFTGWSQSQRDWVAEAEQLPMSGAYKAAAIEWMQNTLQFKAVSSDSGMLDAFKASNRSLDKQFNVEVYGEWENDGIVNAAAARREAKKERRLGYVDRDEAQWIIENVMGKKLE